MVITFPITRHLILSHNGEEYFYKSLSPDPDHYPDHARAAKSKCILLFVLKSKSHGPIVVTHTNRQIDTHSLPVMDKTHEIGSSRVENK